jgi:hypothetical protein
MPATAAVPITASVPAPAAAAGARDARRAARHP